ncbi:MAG TPA: Fic family protein [Alphaproteobacteria bacterium]|nr:Fic family protein [Alphaproteobacteria bacterium]
MNYENLTRKKRALDGFRPLAPALARNLEDWFTIELTYTSNAIEGNTLSRRETAVVIEKGLTVGGKSLKEHLEATNHAVALKFVRSLIRKKPSRISGQDILGVHGLILRGIDDENAGRFRNVPVRISGSAVVMPNPRKVPELMEDFLAWLGEKHDLHPVALAGEAHYRLVSIHPFTDGNGRTARLLMNLMLMQQGYPPAIIRLRDRLAYIGALETAQLGGSRTGYDRLIASAAERSLDIYLNAARGKTAPEAAEKPEAAEHMKIGELARSAGESVSTIRYWTQLGLLRPAHVTPSGYQMFAPDMLARCARIKQLQAERLTLQEIKARLRE